MMIFLLIFFFIQSGTLLGAPEVKLPNGVIRGLQLTSFSGKEYYSFEKIPYAAPPVGSLRFKAPIPPANWDEPLDTLKLDVCCYQTSSDVPNETEDCLYLSVFTPLLPNDNGSVILPVMVYIHGGGFNRGAARDMYSERLIDQDVIFVTMNYRLGPFGFLSTEDDVIPGNNGLKDQQLALQWVKNNIALFGGDSNKITIFGQSAGSASCSYHLLSQNSKDLFQGAILESGTFLSPWTYQRNAKNIAFATAAFLNDTFNTNRNSKDLLEFLQSVQPKDIEAASDQFYNSKLTLQTSEILQGFFWAPVIEEKNPDAFLTKKMYGLLKAGNVVKVPTLVGVTSEEGLAYNQNADATASNMAQFDKNLNWLVPDDMRITDEINRTMIGQKIREIYTGGEPLADHIGAGVRYYTDDSFARGAIKFAELYSGFSDTYFYQFSYVGEYSHQGITYDDAEFAGHSQENRYFFCKGNDCDMSQYPESDQTTKDRLIKIWTDFAKYQNPTPEASDLLQNIIWPEVATQNGDFLYVDIDENLEVKNHPKNATYDKWNDIYNSLGYDDFDTY